MSQTHEKHEGEKKEISIIINAREYSVEKDEITYEDVIGLAFGVVAPRPEDSYSVSYSNAHGNKNGLLLPGTSVKAKEGMVFSATKTTRS